MITSLGSLVEGKLVLVDNRWVILPTDGPYQFVDDLLAKQHNKNVRLVITDLNILENLVRLGCLPGQEIDFVKNMSLEQLNEMGET